MSVGAVAASKAAEGLAKNKATPYVVGAVALVSIGVAVWGTSKIFKTIGGFFDKLGLGDKDEEEQQEENDNLLNDYIKSGQKLSYPEHKYKSIALNLFRAMDGPRNDPQKVANELYKMQNKVDVLKLVQAFDIKSGDTLAEWFSNDYIVSIPFIEKAEIMRPDGSTFSTASMVTLTSIANQVMDDKKINHVF